MKILFVATALGYIFLAVGAAACFVTPDLVMKIVQTGGNK